MSGQDRSRKRKPVRSAGAFLGPGGTFPAAFHTLTDEMPGTPGALEAERRGPAVDVTPPSSSLAWALAVVIAAWLMGSFVLALVVGVEREPAGQARRSSRPAPVGAAKRRAERCSTRYLVGGPACVWKSGGAPKSPRA